MVHRRWWVRAVRFYVWEIQTIHRPGEAQYDR
jgi:hypothetical protein